MQQSTAGIKGRVKHYKYKKPGDSFRVFPNLLSEIQITGPLQCVVSDMTAFCVKDIYLLAHTLYGSLEQRGHNSLSVLQTERQNALTSVDWRIFSNLKIGIRNLG